MGQGKKVLGESPDDNEHDKQSSLLDRAFNNVHDHDDDSPADHYYGSGDDEHVFRAWGNHHERSTPYDNDDSVHLHVFSNDDSGLNQFIDFDYLDHYNEQSSVDNDDPFPA